ncbi:MAG: sigma-54-dependent Fis family transcriptional regulator [Betaproteobacteria bacterium]|nr:sigma-54-dependent Fis family transcriptional regulator [Betaproteobacteria bacterium]
MSENKLVLVVDDEADIRELLAMTLTRMGVQSHGAASCAEALALLRAQDYALCLTDMRLPDGDGLSVLDYVAKNHPATPVAVITAHGSTENAVAALKAGAFDYLAKPVSLEQLRALIRSALNLPRAVELDTVAAAPAICGPRLLGSSPQMREARQMIEKLARSQAPIHITGESGSGKELAARSVHDKGSRQAAPFVPVNCGAIPENLMESEFFGYKKGAFTGAAADRDGFFQAANGGTLFLDEVADLPLPMQVKLLRAIQEKRVRKVGSTAEENVDVRIISATHRNLAAEVKNGSFRQDLYYRLNVIELRMPSLREMREDIPMLAQMLLARLTGEGAAARLSPEALTALQAYDFPGNVRELENVLERALTLAGGNEITRADLQLNGATVPRQQAPAAAAAVDAYAITAEIDLSSNLSLPEKLENIERQAIMAALEKSQFNRTAAAKLLGVSFRALRYRMERLGIKDELDAKRQE